MPLDLWSDRNESLNAISSAVQHRTHGLIDDLSLEQFGDDCIILQGTARSYYGVQLAIQATKLLGEQRSDMPEIQLQLNVRGHPLRLSNVRSFVSGTGTSTSTEAAVHHQKLVTAECEQAVEAT